MNTISRRHFLKLVGASTAVAASPTLLKAQTATARQVVVVGGGFAGATAAKYLSLWSNGGIAVTLVDANPAHVSCILSNLVLNNSLRLEQITFKLDALQPYGVNLLQGQATGIGGGKLLLADGRSLGYDRLILAPGIDFDFGKIGVQDPANLLHAWQAGPQTTLLQQQLNKAMPAGGTFVLTIPPAPYRCPPGPYERACLVADYLKKNKSGSKVIVLDANPEIIAEKNTFTKAFNETHKGYVEYHPGAIVTAVNAGARTIAYSENGQQKTLRASVLNVLPPQKAGKIAFDAGLVPAGQNWAPIDPLSYESTQIPGVHVIGDAQGTGQPKSGHIANAEAKVCADAILRTFAGEAPDPAPTTNSACYSPITANTASWLTAVFAYDPNTLDPVTGKGVMRVVPESFGEAPAATRDNYEKMFDWAGNLFADTFA